ncbi:MAG: hypothetical protein IPH93_16535 [Saprospiraceae bacterium]|nr:hypothetical protein [Saprospiraceae bacterium]
MTTHSENILSSMQQNILNICIQSLSIIISVQPHSSCFKIKEIKALPIRKNQLIGIRFVSYNERVFKLVFTIIQNSENSVSIAFRKEWKISCQIELRADKFGKKMSIVALKCSFQSEDMYYELLYFSDVVIVNFSPPQRDEELKLLLLKYYKITLL